MTFDPRPTSAASKLPHRRHLLAGAGAALATLGLPRAARSQSESRAEPDGASGPIDGDGKRLLILGGTGFLGPHVVEAARERGWEVTLFNRGRTNTHLFPEVEKLVGDRDPEKGAGLSALEGDRRWDYVVDTTSYAPSRTAAAVELLRDRIDRYALVSTISVFESFEAHGMDESAPVGRMDDPSNETVTNSSYGPLKALCEERAEELMPGRVANVRPGLIVGPMDPTDRFTYWPVRATEGGTMLAPGNVDDPVQFIDVRDLAEFLVHCLAEDHMGVYNATGPTHGETIAGLVYACRAATNAGTRVRWVDAETVSAMGLRPWGHLPVWTPRTGGIGGMSTIDVSKAIAAGLVSRPTADTVRDTLAWWAEQPSERQLTRAMDLEMEAEVLAKVDVEAVVETTPEDAPSEG